MRINLKTHFLKSQILNIKKKCSHYKYKEIAQTMNNVNGKDYQIAPSVKYFFTNNIV